MLEVDIHRSPAQDDDPAERGTERNGTRILISYSTHVEQRQDFSMSTGTLGQEKSVGTFRHFD